MIITIGGTFGSGGKGVAEDLSKLLGYKLCDDELVLEVVKDLDIDLKESTFQLFDESSGTASLDTLKTLSSIPGKNSYTALVSALSTDVVPLDRKIAAAQEELINRLADEDNVILMGRCANYYLRKRSNCLRVFCVDLIENRIKRIQEIHKVTEKEAAKIILNTDKRRRDYFSFFTHQSWGDIEYYDVCVNIAPRGVEKTTQYIKAIVDVAVGK